MKVLFDESALDTYNEWAQTDRKRPARRRCGGAPASLTYTFQKENSQNSKFFLTNIKKSL
jgi:hypothetical protein